MSEKTVERYGCVRDFCPENGQTCSDVIDRLRAALEELLDVAERIRGGDPQLDPEQWYATRDYARKVLKDGR